MSKRNSRRRWRGALLVLGVLPLVVACSTTNNITSPCGTGTVVVDGVCVAANNDAATDAAESDAADSSVPSTDSGALPTDSSTALDTTDGSAADAPDASAWTPDPCPTSSYVNCSKDCDGVGPRCNEFVSCPTKALIHWGPSPVVRVPAYVDAPVCDKFCATSQARGAYFHISVSKSSILRVSPPWAIAGSPGLIGCPPVKGSNCKPVLGDMDFVVFTTDPTAPARNVTITSATTDKCP